MRLSLRSALHAATKSITNQIRSAAFGAAIIVSASTAISVTLAQTASTAQARDDVRYSENELVNVGHQFFGTASSGLASLIEKAVEQYGQPNGYVLGEEASGALVGGLRYGEGSLFTKNAGDHKVYWQGPSIGWDFGGDGNRTMMLVYNLSSTEKLYRRYIGVSGSAYFIGGLGMTVLKHGDTVLVPVRTGVGARLGINVGYLKMRPYATWNPF